MADITNLFYVEETDVDEVGSSTTETIYAIALEDSHDGVVCVCTSTETCSDQAEAYQEAVEGGDEEAIAAALYNLRVVCSTGYDPDYDVSDSEDTVEEWNDEIDEAIAEEDDYIEDYVDPDDYDEDDGEEE